MPAALEIGEESLNSWIRLGASQALLDLSLGGVIGAPVEEDGDQGMSDAPVRVVGGNEHLPAKGTGSLGQSLEGRAPDKPGFIPAQPTEKYVRLGPGFTAVQSLEGGPANRGVGTFQAGAEGVKDDGALTTVQGRNGGHGLRRRTWAEKEFDQSFNLSLA